MKFIPYITLISLAFLAEACSTSPKNLTPAQLEAAHVAIGRQMQQFISLQQTTGRGTTYTPLKWRKTTLLHTKDAGEAAVHEAVGLWFSDQIHSSSFMDSVANLQGRAREFNSAAWERASKSATAADKRAANRGYRLTPFIDSVQRASRLQTPDAGVIGQRGWLTYQLISQRGESHRDSMEYIILNSGKAFLCIPQAELSKRFWESDTREFF